MTKTVGNKPKMSLVERSATKYHLNSFFAGIGGFDLGFEKAGIAPAFHCEINEFCNSVLQRHWPEVPSVRDIVEVKASELPDSEIWCAGFPCQDVSLARSWRGRDGLRGKNTGLFFPFINLVKARNPKVVILENVVGLLNSHKGNDFKVVIESLTKLGYGVAWRVMNTRYFGSPQSRPRVYISAVKGNLDRAIRNLYEKEFAPMPSRPREGFLLPSICNKTKAIVPQISYCIAATSGRHTGTDWSRSYVSYHDRVRRLTPAECEGLQGFPVGWTLPADNFEQSDEDIDTLRYHAIGNAVSVSVVNWIGKRIISTLSKEESSCAAGEWDQILQAAANASDSFGDEKKVAIRKFSDIEKMEIRWQSGGCAYQDTILDTSVSPAPIRCIGSKFIEHVESKSVDDKYFLSPNAAEGIIRRVNNQGRTLFKPLSDALHRMVGLDPQVDEVDNHQVA